jgi:hypothetical protein
MRQNRSIRDFPLLMTEIVFHALGAGAGAGAGLVPLFQVLDRPGGRCGVVEYGVTVTLPDTLAPVTWLARLPNERRIPRGWLG